MRVQIFYGLRRDDIYVVDPSKKRVLSRLFFENGLRNSAELVFKK
jgi:hypothetical protein